VELLYVGSNIIELLRWVVGEVRNAGDIAFLGGEGV
jgi:hypothetical protein